MLIWDRIWGAAQPAIAALRAAFLAPGVAVEKEQAKTVALRAAGTCAMCEEARAEPGRDTCYPYEISWKR